MTPIPLGKVAVPVHGTPVSLGALIIAAATAASITLGPNNAICKIEIWAVPGNTGAVVAKARGTIVASLPTPANGHAEHWHVCSECKNTLDPTLYSIDAVTTDTDGAYVTAWVS